MGYITMVYIIKLDGKEIYNTETSIILDKGLKTLNKQYGSERISWDIVEKDEYYKRKNIKLLKDCCESLFRKYKR